MKRSIFFLVIIVIILCSKAKGATPEFFKAIRQVETGNQPNGGRDSIGDNGRSKGPYQIGLAYFKDSGVKGQWDDVRDAAFAERVMLAYWKRYAPAALEAQDFEVLARVHNGGPSGARKKATLGYWAKVKATLNK